MIRFLLPVALLSTAACQPHDRTVILPPAPEATPCGAEKVAQHVGKKRTDAIATQVAKLSGAKSIRWIKPGMAVTMDYREDRLNVRIDEKGVIRSITCG